MGRILAIDYGQKRTGIAVTDPLKIIASGLTTVPTSQVVTFLTEYLQQEVVEQIVVGLPLHPDGNPAQIAHEVDDFARKLSKVFPQIPIRRQDERYTSRQAKDIILQSGIRKKKRQDKSRVDKVAAALILEQFMQDNFW